MTKPGQERRLLILLAARELLTERGSPTAVSLQDIAARAGTTKVTLYRYFASKEALFAEVAASLDDPSEIRSRRDEIMDAAMRVIPRYGLHSVTMERIAEETGVSAATLYWHFKNKEDLLMAMLDRMISQIDIASLLPPTPLEDADALMTSFAPRIIQIFNERIVLMPIVMAEIMTHPELAARVYDRLATSVWAVVTGFMDAQVKAGVFRPGHAYLRMFALVGMMMMYSLARRNFGAWIDLPPPEQAAREAVDLFLHGVVVDKTGGETDG